jgi:uncharacterized membrane protein
MSKILMLRWRLAVSLLCGLGLYFFLPIRWGIPLRPLISWDFSAAIYIIWSIGIMTSDVNSQRLRRYAALQDESRWIFLILMCFAAVASLGAIVGLLPHAKDSPPPLFIVHIATAAVTIMASWTLIHIIFAFHYAHDYYGDADPSPDAYEEQEGLKFPGKEQPVYLDFLYYSFVVGMTCQVSDVQITSRGMRRQTMIHGVLSFFFNTVILAISINIAASLLS